MCNECTDLREMSHRVRYYRWVYRNAMLMTREEVSEDKSKQCMKEMYDALDANSLGEYMMKQADKSTVTAFKCINRDLDRIDRIKAQAHARFKDPKKLTRDQKYNLGIYK